MLLTITSGNSTSVKYRYLPISITISQEILDYLKYVYSKCHQIFTCHYLQVQYFADILSSHYPQLNKMYRNKRCHSNTMYRNKELNMLQYNEQLHPQPMVPPSSCAVGLQAPIRVILCCCGTHMLAEGCYHQ